MMDYRCLYCLARMIEQRIIKNKIESAKALEISRYCLAELAAADDTLLMPEIAATIHREFRRVSGVADPYKEEKHSSTQIMLALIPYMEELIAKSEDSFMCALKIAIAGNIIDVGPGHEFNIEKTIQHTLAMPFAIDDSAVLRRAISEAKSILYLADNAGEIVADKLFIRSALSGKNVYFSVRGGPILNDATLEDALEAKLDEVAVLVANGDDAPSTMLHRVEAELIELYQSCDLIISKGMGNFEGLYKERSEKLFFLFTVKCAVIAEMIHAERGSNVVVQASRLG